MQISSIVIAVEIGQNHCRLSLVAVDQMESLADDPLALTISSKPHSLVISERRAVLLTNEGLDGRKPPLARGFEALREKRRGNPAACGRWPDVSANDPPADWSSIRIASGGDL